MMMKALSWTRRHVVWLIWTLVVAAMAFQWTESARLHRPERSANAVERQAPYPPARWRLATQAELEPSLLWVSHILIRYEGASSGIAFSAPGWHNSLPASHPSRERALAAAETVAGELRLHPEQFASYAERFSEDPPTRASGGSLGGVSAYQLSFWPSVLDALSTLVPGEVSDPVETEYGFHVLLRRQPPAAEIVTGAHIVVAHDDARWLHNMLARGSVPSRTREQARALAQMLYEQVRREPAQFSAFVDKYSEALDAAQAGDLGTWSTHETTPYPRQVETLRSLPVGGIAPPFESLLGFEVLMRVPNRPRKEYAMTAIGLIFDPLAEENSPLSKASVLKVARSLRHALDEEPSRFEEFQKDYCCANSLRWRQGSEFPELDEPLDQLELGQVSPEPIESLRQYLIPKRLDPDAIEQPEVRFDLPAPEHPDLPYLVGRMSATRAREALRRFARSSLPALSLGPSQMSRLVELHEHPWPPALDDALTELRSDAFQEFLQQLERDLQPQNYGQYRGLLELEIAELELHGEAR
jgi:PPIC-type peptidyl-prolyl cis-trans isomerase-like protein